MTTSVTVPLSGDERYKAAFAAMTREKGVSMARAVRSALDSCYGGEIAAYLLFFDEHVNQNLQSSIQKVEGISTPSYFESQVSEETEPK